MKRNYKITVGSRVADNYPRGTAELMIDKNGTPFLWLGYENKCIAWIDPRSIKAIAKQICKRKAAK